MNLLPKTKIYSANRNLSYAFLRKLSECRNIRGMPDKLDLDLRRKKYIVDVGEKILRPAGYTQIDTPILEFTSTFVTGVGESSDIATKEMYSFNDRNGSSIALRPEGTAGVTRAFITNNLYKQLPQKLYYSGPMFRHERPQKGRYRQFDQFGIEIYGIHNPTADVEALLMSWEFIRKLGLSENSKIKLNSLGDKETRQTYSSALVKFFESRRDKLSPDSAIRLEKNPLRILDSKSPEDIQVLIDAPKISDSLNDASLKRFKFIQTALKDLEVAFEVDEKLVRGLDYYDHTVWELVYEGSLLGKSQDTILAGGRYNSLVKQMGCSYDVPGIGWAAGIERLSLLMSYKQENGYLSNVSVLLVPEKNILADKNTFIHLVSAEVASHGMRVVSKLLGSGIRASLIHSTLSGNNENVSYPKLSKQLGSAIDNNSDFAVIIGTNEVLENTLILRNLKNKSQKISTLDSLINDVLENQH